LVVVLVVVVNIYIYILPTYLANTISPLKSGPIMQFSGLQEYYAMSNEKRSPAVWRSDLAPPS